MSGTFYCDGEVAGGAPGSMPAANSDTTCGEVSAYGYWNPKPTLFIAPGVTRPAHILDIHGQLPPNGGEGGDTAPPALDQDYASSTWAGWGDAAGCYTVQVSSQTEQTLAATVGGRVVKSYAYSQAADQLPTRCAGLDLTFYIAQGGVHVPGGFEATAWCYLSTVGGRPSSSACPSQPTNATATSTPTATPTREAVVTATSTPTATPSNSSPTATSTATPRVTATTTSTPEPTPTGLMPRAYLPSLVQ